MPAYRFFLDSRFIVGEIYELPPSEKSHVRVMRIHEGNELELVNGLGQLAKALLERKGIVKVTDVYERPPKREVILCQAIPRLNRLDTIVEKGTELSMTHLWLFAGERSEKKCVGAQRLERLHSISISALKQSGRLYLPIIEEKPPLKEWLLLPHQAFFGDLEKKSYPFAPNDQNICFFIGPEAGWSDQEKIKLCELGAIGVRLGPNILRTDTASLVALSLVQLNGEYNDS